MQVMLCTPNRRLDTQMFNVQDEADKQEAALAQRQEEELAQRSMAEFGLADATAAEPVDHADTEAAAKASTASDVG